MIGLLTPYRVSNYGTKLQAYAVQETIARMGLDAEIIHCAPYGERTRIGNIWYKCLGRLIRARYHDTRSAAAGNPDIEKLRAQRSAAINGFDQSHLRLSDEILSREQLADYAQKTYHTVLCGSDQIWNPYNICSNFYLLEWVNDRTAKIAYSPSFGVASLPWLLKWKYRQELRRFRGISVRESSGKKLLEELGFPQAEHTLDPTLAVERKVWYELAEQGRELVSSGYVLCYFLGGSRISRQIASAAAQTGQMRIVTFPHLESWNEADESSGADRLLYDVKVPDFVRLIRDAACVVTDSFHATAFAIMFHKPFMVTERHGSQRYSTNTRLSSLLEMLGLEDRRCSHCEQASSLLTQPIDYDRVEKVLEIKAEETRQYLQKHLKTQGEEHAG